MWFYLESHIKRLRIFKDLFFDVIAGLPLSAALSIYCPKMMTLSMRAYLIQFKVELHKISLKLA